MNILAVESSCDETAVAIVKDGREVLTDCIASQVALHREYGGVVPEIASRKHIEAIYALADQALEETGLTAELDATQRAVIEYPLRPAGRKQVVFFAGQVSGEPKIRPGEIESFKWVLAEELQNYLFPDTVEACQQLIEEKSYAFSQDLC